MKHIKRSGRSGGGAKRQYLSRGEVAQLFEVSPATIARWAREGRLPHVSTLGGHRRYRTQEILAIVEKLSHPGSGGSSLVSVSAGSRRRA